MKKTGFYIIKDKFFEDMQDPYLKGNKAGNRPHFDMVIMDEASQCNTAVGLVPIIRGRTLMLVGDPQQLSPVILLDDVANQK